MKSKIAESYMDSKVEEAERVKIGVVAKVKECLELI